MWGVVPCKRVTRGVCGSLQSENDKLRCLPRTVPVPVVPLYLQSGSGLCVVAACNNRHSSHCLTRHASPFFEV